MPILQFGHVGADRVRHAGARVLTREIDAIEITVTMLRHAGHAGEQLVFDQREVAAGANVRAVERAIGGFDVSAAVTVRALREQLDGAAERVLAGERALRTAQHFDAVDVEQVEHRAQQDAVVDVIDVDADARFEGEAAVVLADAADVGLRDGAEARGTLHAHDVRRERGDIGDRGGAASLKLLGVHGGDGDRRLLQTLLAELRGDHHLFEDHRLIAGCVLRQRHCLHTARSRCRQRRQPGCPPGSS